MDQQGTNCAPEEIPAAYLEFLDNRIGNDPQELFALWDQEIFKIGRDARSNAFAIETDLDHAVSRNHCEVYVVVYEPSINHIYVRDRGSCNGTYVNGQNIGKGSGISSGFLLRDGDIFEIKPHWSFILRQARSPPRHDLTSLQMKECEMFSDRYILTDRCLGQGAEAAVYLSVDVSTKKQLVCKLVNLDKHQGKDAREEMRRSFQEADILRQLNHPNILPYIDAISSPHTLYTFTELASGGDLMSFIFRHITVKELDARLLLRQVIRGLKYLHSKGIVHRDLKPENILLTCSPRTAYHRVVLSDFGTSTVPRRSRMMTNVGTLAYKAPEFQSSTRFQTSAVDIWSLGIVSLVLLTASPEIEPSDISGFDQAGQQEIECRLKSVFSKMIKQPSANGKKFIWDCLQRLPTDRLTATEAECHEWLCKPQRYLDFFERLDIKMKKAWIPQTEIRPMPLELPSVVGNELPSLDSHTSHHDQANEQEPCHPPLATTTSSHHFQKQKSKDSGIASEFFENTEPQSCSEVQVCHSANETRLIEMPPKQTRPPWEGFQKPTSPFSQSDQFMRKVAKFKIHDAALLPLTNLDRHLHPHPDRNHRRQVLEELKKTNSKFLIEKSPFVPATPVKEQRTQTPKAPRKRNKRVALAEMRSYENVQIPPFSLG